MAKLRKKHHKESKGLLAWRRKQKRGSIMKRKTFEEIEHEAAGKGYKSAKAVAGKAYWTTAKSKYKRYERRAALKNRGNRRVKHRK